MPAPRTAAHSSPHPPSVSQHLARRAVEQAVAARQAEYEGEVARIVEATFELVGRTGTVDPSMRDILSEASLSTQAFYRYFRSKDELLLALLDEGRRRLLDTLRRRMQKAGDATGQLRAWIEGVLAQAAEPAAARTRPWVANQDRLAERFPEEHEASVDALVALLDEPVRTLRGGGAGAHQAALLVYRVSFSTLQAHLARGTRPSATETRQLVAFCEGGVMA